MSELAEIYRIYFDDVYRYLLALSHDAQLAEELTSETFCRAMRALPGFRPESGGAAHGPGRCRTHPGRAPQRAGAV